MFNVLYFIVYFTSVVSDSFVVIVFSSLLYYSFYINLYFIIIFNNLFCFGVVVVF